MALNVEPFELSPPLDLTHHLSEVTKQRLPSEIKRFYKYFAIPGVGNLAGGLPHPSYFPFDTLESQSALPHRFKPTPNNPVGPPSTINRHKKDNHNAYLNDPSSTRVFVPHQSHEPNVLKRIDLNTALQYGTAQGYPPLYQFVREFALTRLHPNIPYQNGAEVILTCGSTDGFAKSLECFTNTWTPNGGKPISEREGMLCEEFAYMNAIQAAKPRGLNIAPVAIDAEGMLAYGHPRSLYNVLSRWDVERDGGKRPHIMYTVTMGQNPTSGLLSVKRRKEIYELCQKYDVLIIEDDPYFYIQFPHAANDFTQKHRDGELISLNHFAESNLNYQTSLAVPVRGTTRGQRGTVYPSTKMKRGNSSGSEFLDSLVPSYLSLDVDGRVIRLDTFSKTVAPGCRLGWITAQPAFIDRILRITETSTQQPSGFVQSLVAELLVGPDNNADQSHKPSKAKDAKGWKMEGWIRWLEGLRGNYERRMQIMSETLEQGKFVTAVAKTDTAAILTTTKGNLPVGRKHRLDPIIACSHSRVSQMSQSNQPHDQANEEDSDAFEVLDRTQIYDFNPPMAGMFLWLKYNTENHPVAGGSLSLSQISFAFWLFQTKKPYLVLTAPGTMFSPSKEILDEEGWKYFRLCFAAVDENELKDISERFVKAAQDFWELSEKDIQELLEEDEASVDSRIQALSGDLQEKWTFSPLMC